MKATEAPKPVVHVAPVYPAHAIEEQACVIVSFSLHEKKGTNGKALVPVKIKAEAFTSKKFVKPSVKAVSKWLYLSKSANTKKRYYTEVKFELE
jgi:hypothetical protein